MSQSGHSFVGGFGSEALHLRLLSLAILQRCLLPFCTGWVVIASSASGWVQHLLFPPPLCYSPEIRMRQEESPRHVALWIPIFLPTWGKNSTVRMKQGEDPRGVACESSFFFQLRERTVRGFLSSIAFLKSGCSPSWEEEHRGSCCLDRNGTRCKEWMLVREFLVKEG